MGELYDPYSYAIQDNPFEVYRVLRDEQPAYYNAERGFFALSRFEDVLVAARDHDTYTIRGGGNLEVDELGSFMPFESTFIDMDPPRHDELRKVVQPWFTPKAINALEPEIASLVDALLEPLRGRGTVDLAADFAQPLPVMVISGLLGIPRADWQTVKRWSDEIHLRDPDSDSVPEQGMQAGWALRGYFEELIAERRERRCDDLVSELVHAGVDGVPLTHDEILGSLFLIFLAGNETTGNLISTSLHLLAHHREQRERLAADPSSIPNAVEELLRFDSPTQNLARVAKKDVTIHGSTIPAGASVLLLYGSANRDEREFDDPDRLDLSRAPKRHLAFGDGIHFCLGAPLARLEMQVALERFVSAFPDYELAGAANRFRSPYLRGFLSVPARLAPNGGAL